MSKSIWWGLCVVVFAVTPTLANAGWIIKWENTPIRKGDRLESSDATAYIDGNRTRLEQDHITTVTDYGKGTFSLLNPKSKFYWSGTVETYAKESVKRRNAVMKSRMGSKASEDSDELPEVDVETLPKITIEPTDEKLIIAGHETFKHVIRVNDELFQEVWVATDLDLTDDLDPKKVAEYQQTASRGMIGNSAKPYNALYRSPEYVKLLKKGFALKTLIHHIAGSFEQSAKSVRESDIAPASFRVPKDYRRVRLQDVFTVDQQ